ncbi:hypothetical protein [Ichthyenterobacterium magnum]|uniref:hypothetical protein n=1 Tax=Ichthyenterobacterium magnum TaxID=1230530 RepID=UPI000E75087B|nr:hypothetical protein [Ichthyenterobacterium magnum]
MSLFKQRKNKHFNYTPRHLRKEQNQSDEKLQAQWELLRQTGKSRGKKIITLPILLLILGMIIVLWYVLSNYES